MSLIDEKQAKYSCFVEASTCWVATDARIPQPQHRHHVISAVSGDVTRKRGPMNGVEAESEGSEGESEEDEGCHVKPLVRH